MRIGFFLRDLKIEGVQVVTLRLAETLVNMGHQCELITLNGAQELELVSGILHHSLDIEKRVSFKKSKQYVEKFLSCIERLEENNDKFDAVFSVHGETNDIISYIDNPKLIHCIHNSDEYTYNNKNWFDKLKFRRKLTKKIKAKHVICVSNGIRDFVKAKTNSSALSISTIYNPFDIEKIKQLSLEEPVYKLPQDYILFVGRLEMQKNIPLLLESVSKMKTNIPLVIIGEGSLEAELKQQAIKLGINHKVLFFPFCLNPYSIMRKARALVLTSHHEGLPTVLIEALILGTAAVSSNCPTGPAEILIGNYSKYLIDSELSKKIAQHIDSVLADIIQVNENDIIQRFSADIIGHQYLDIIKKEV
ncbi:glycosyltransferase [Photobacterium sp. S4TG1]|uniref:glycosyltransferase n=1 Tax=Photobacterium sp. S4TG1 TaxID=3114587 RepID=UPI002E187FC0|nr:glycosyltransferase [Photobacterium sp. S4TG1]